MNGTAWIVLVVVVLIIVGVVAAVGLRRQRAAQHQRGRDTAAHLRRKGTETELDARARVAEAAGQQAEAEKVQIEAERMRQKAQQTQSEAGLLREKADEQLRKADEVDPGSGRHRDNGNGTTDRPASAAEPVVPPREDLL